MPNWVMFFLGNSDAELGNVFLGNSDAELGNSDAENTQQPVLCSRVSPKIDYKCT